jgi:hypothetical protein
MAFDIAPVADTVASATVYIILAILALALLGVLGWLYWLKRQYKYLVHLKVLKNGTFSTFYDTARQINKDGEKYWKLRKLKEHASVPPPEAITQTLGGAWVADGYYERNIGVLWAKDAMNRQEFEKLAESLREQRERDPNAKVDAINTRYQPITSQERALQASQITKAVIRKGKSGWEIFKDLIYPILIFMVLVLIVIFWKNISEPIIQTSAQNAQISEQNAKVQEQNLRFYIMLTGGHGNITYAVQPIPQDQQLFPQAFAQAHTG